MKKQVDYSKLRGFNYTLPISMNDMDFWLHYDHDIVARDMSYAQRLQLNSARIFLSYNMYAKDPELFLANIKDFVHTAWQYGVSTNPIIFMGFRFDPNEKFSMELDEYGFRPISSSLDDPSQWHYGEEYCDALIDAIGDEEGLLFWDIANEPGYTDNFVTWYDEEPKYVQDFKIRPSEERMKVLKERQEKTWNIVRHFLKYVKSKDPDHDIGVGNIFTWETEPSGTIDLVDVIIFHDYSSTWKRLDDVLTYTEELSRKYNKPIVDNEMCCLCRANPYDMAIELHNEHKCGWYLFELMIGTDMWTRVHGVVYPDGTVRDPSIVAAIMGFYRNRTETAIRPDVDQEDYCSRALILGERVNRAVRRNNRHDHTTDVAEVLEVAEFAARLLEGGELVPMAYPPTARINAMRKRTDVDVQEALDLMTELLNTLKSACHVDHAADLMHDSRV